MPWTRNEMVSLAPGLGRSLFQAVPFAVSRDRWEALMVIEAAAHAPRTGWPSSRAASSTAAFQLVRGTCMSSEGTSLGEDVHLVRYDAFHSQ